MRRIGFIGTENSHTDHFIRFLNTEGRHPGFTAVALAGGTNDRNDQLRRDGGIEHVVDEPADLIPVIDAAVISSRDGALHREQAEPLVAAGIPVLVDKPLATTVPDAEAIVDAGEATSTVVVSASALRFVPQIAVLSESSHRGPLRHLTVVGPADPDSEYSGLFFYGIHHVEAALEILGNPTVDPASIRPTVHRDEDTMTAHLHIGDVSVTFVFLTPGRDHLGDHRVPFHATAVRSDAVVAHELTLDADYNAPTLARFTEAVEKGHSPAGREELLSPVVVLSAIVNAA